jgi:hypothetical protein
MREVDKTQMSGAVEQAGKGLEELPPPGNWNILAWHLNCLGVVV